MEIIPFGTYFKKHFSTKCRAWKYISATRFIIKYESVLHREKGCTGERKKLHIKKNKAWVRYLNAGIIKCLKP